MKQWQVYSAFIALLIGFLTLGGYGYNISAFASGLATRVGFLEKQREEDKQEIKENLNYIRARVDEIARDMKNSQSASNCGQCKDH